MIRFQISTAVLPNSKRLNGNSNGLHVFMAKETGPLGVCVVCGDDSVSTVVVYESFLSSCGDKIEV
jgi:hypothetical protein